MVSSTLPYCVSTGGATATVNVNSAATPHTKSTPGVEQQFRQHQKVAHGKESHELWSYQNGVADKYTKGCRTQSTLRQYLPGIYVIAINRLCPSAALDRRLYTQLVAKGDVLPRQQNTRRFSRTRSCWNHLVNMFTLENPPTNDTMWHACQG